VKLTWKKCDEGMKSMNLTKVEASTIVCRISIHKNQHSKTLHLQVEINNYLVGLMDTIASMFVMFVGMVHELGIIHLVSKSKYYKITFGVVTQVLRRINELIVRVGDVQCLMTFMIVDINSSDLLLGLDFLIKIGVVVDVEKGLIQVK
jgi:hypothetical protein